MDSSSNGGNRAIVSGDPRIFNQANSGVYEQIMMGGTHNLCYTGNAEGLSVQGDIVNTQVNVLPPMGTFIGQHNYQQCITMQGQNSPSVTRLNVQNLPGYPSMQSNMYIPSNNTLPSFNHCFLTSSFHQQQQQPSQSPQLYNTGTNQFLSNIQCNPSPNLTTNVPLGVQYTQTPAISRTGKPVETVVGNVAQTKPRPEVNMDRLGHSLNTGPTWLQQVDESWLAQVPITIPVSMETDYKTVISSATPSMLSSPITTTTKSHPVTQTTLSHDISVDGKLDHQIQKVSLQQKPAIEKQTPAEKDFVPKAEKITSVVVPVGWRRENIDGAIIYYSPTNTPLCSPDEINKYLMSDSTCKCGLECPLLVNKTFNFDVHVESKEWSLDVTKSEDLMKLCNHRRKLVTLAEFHSSAHTSQEKSNCSKQQEKGKSKKKRNKSTGHVGHERVLVSELIAERDRLKSSTTNISSTQAAGLPSQESSANSGIHESSITNSVEHESTINKPAIMQESASATSGSVSSLENINVKSRIEQDNLGSQSESTANTSVENIDNSVVMQGLLNKPLVTHKYHEEVSGPENLESIPENLMENPKIPVENPVTALSHQTHNIDKLQENPTIKHAVSLENTVMKTLMSPEKVRQKENENEKLVFEYTSPPTAEVLQTSKIDHPKSVTVGVQSNIDIEEMLTQQSNKTSTMEMSTSRAKTQTVAPKSSRALIPQDQTQMYFQQAPSQPSVTTSYTVTSTSLRYSSTDAHQTGQTSPQMAMQSNPYFCSPGHLQPASNIQPLANPLEPKHSNFSSYTDAVNINSGYGLSYNYMDKTANSYHMNYSKPSMYRFTNPVLSGLIDPSSWSERKKARTKKPRAKKEKKKTASVFESDTPPPNVDVSVLKDQGRGPIPNVTISTPSTTCSFLDNPTGFLAEQTALISSSLASSAEPKEKLTVQCVSNAFPITSNTVVTKDSFDISTNVVVHTSQTNRTDVDATSTNKSVQALSLSDNTFTEDRCHSLSPSDSSGECPAETMTPSSVVHHTGKADSSKLEMKSDLIKSADRMNTNVQSVTKASESPILPTFSSIQQMLGCNVSNQFPASNLLSAAARAQMAQKTINIPTEPSNTQMAQQLLSSFQKTFLEKSPLNMNLLSSEQITTRSNSESEILSSNFQFMTAEKTKLKNTDVTNTGINSETPVYQTTIPTQVSSSSDSNTLLNSFINNAQQSQILTTHQKVGVGSQEAPLISSPLVQTQTAQIPMTQTAPIIYTQAPTSILNTQTTPMINTQTTPIINTQPTPIINAQSAPLLSAVGNMNQNSVMFPNPTLNCGQNSSVFNPVMNPSSMVMPGNLAYTPDQCLPSNFNLGTVGSQQLVNNTANMCIKPLVNGQFFNMDTNSIKQTMSAQSCDLSQQSNMPGMSNQSGQLLVLPNLQIPLVQVFGNGQKNGGNHINSLVAQLQSNLAPMFNAQQVWNNLTTGSNLTAMQLQTLQLQQQLLQQIQQLQGMQSLINQFNSTDANKLQQPFPLNIDSSDKAANALSMVTMVNDVSTTTESPPLQNQENEEEMNVEINSEVTSTHIDNEHHSPDCQNADSTQSACSVNYNNKDEMNNSETMDYSCSVTEDTLCKNQKEIQNGDSQKSADAGIILSDRFEVNIESSQHSSSSDLTEVLKSSQNSFDVMDAKNDKNVDSTQMEVCKTSEDVSIHSKVIDTPKDRKRTHLESDRKFYDRDLNFRRAQLSDVSQFSDIQQMEVESEWSESSENPKHRDSIQTHLCEDKFICMADSSHKNLVDETEAPTGNDVLAVTTVSSTIDNPYSQVEANADSSKFLHDGEMRNLDSSVIFVEGDLIWGQIRGFPSWPGKIVPPCDVIDPEPLEMGKIWVKWYGDHTFTQVEQDKLKSLVDGLKSHQRQKNRKGRKMNSNLEAAIQEALSDMDQKTAHNIHTKAKAVKKKKVR